MKLPASFEANDKDDKTELQTADAHSKFVLLKTKESITEDENTSWYKEISL